MCRRKSFVLYTDIRTTYNQMSDEEIGRLHRFIADYNYIDLNNAEEVANFENRLKQDRIISLAFAPIRAQFERDEAKYDNIVEKRRKAGKRGGYAKAGKNPDDDGSKQESSLPVVLETKQPEVDFERMYSAWSKNLLENKKEKEWFDLVSKETGILNFVLAFQLFREHLIKNAFQSKFTSAEMNYEDRKRYFIRASSVFATSECKRKASQPVATVVMRNGKRYVSQSGYERELPENAPNQPSPDYYFDFGGGWNCWRKG